MLFTSKLTPEQWTEARRLRAEGATLAALGEQFGVRPDTIRARAKKEAWPSLIPPAAVPAPHRRTAVRTMARPRPTPAATAVIKRSLVPRLFNVIDIQLKLTELRMQQNLKAAETAIEKGEPLPAIDDGDKEMRHVSTTVKAIQQVTEIAPELSKHVHGGALSTSAAASASETDAFQSRVVEGPRLSELRITASSEGAAIPRLYGRARLGGQVIWATSFEEEVVRQGSGGSGKGLPSGGAATTIEYRYFVSFAVALAEGEISGIGRVWADGRELDLSTVTWRLYKGSDDQLPDSLIEAKEGAGNAPAYRGLAYIVFERMALADFGNRVPQLSFEVHRAVDAFDHLVRAVCLIPGAGEFVYATQAVSRRLGRASHVADNVHTLQGGPDWTIAIDQLQAGLPNVASVSLVVGWFGTDLRADHCQVRPGVDAADRITEPLTWSVAGLDRGDAHLISTIEGRAAYGGTPSDQTVVAAIQDLQERGLGVVLAPFIFMDVPAGNSLPDPHTGAAAQPAYPWRGRITLDPAPGQPGSPDQTAAAAAQIAAFVGTAAVSDFAVSDDEVLYTGPDEWSYRRFILHTAHLAAAAGGVDAFIIGSELRGLSQARDSASTYPFVAALVALAADVKAILGPATKVTDGAYGKPWIYRYKDIGGWWSAQHFDRPAGVESATPTAWVPQSKPFWFTEIGCPAVDKGANQPNVFVDPKSAESGLPHYSKGSRDDFMQRRHLHALHRAFGPASPLNPISTVYGGPMVDPDRLHVYCWDARPYPAFPNDTDAWGDGPNWRLGHWIAGRLASAPLDAAVAVAAILADYGFADFDAGALAGTLSGYALDRVLSARDALQPLELAYFIDARESDGRIVFAHRGGASPVADVAEDALVERRPGDALATLTRAQETDLPASAKISYISGAGSYPQAVEEARRLTGQSGRVAVADLPIVLEAEQAAQIAETWLFEAWAARERAAFSLPPSRLALEPGDLVTLDVGGRTRLVRITEIGEHGTRDIDARSIDPAVYAVASPAVRPSSSRPGGVPAGQPLPFFLDLPLLRGDEPPHAGYVAAAQSPWPGAVAFYRSPEAANFLLKAVATAPATTGVTLDPLPTGPPSRLDRASVIRVELDQGALTSVTDLALLGGANAAAIQNADGEWEVLQFQSAELIAPSTYELSVFLRGQAGTEAAMRAPVAPGARFVLLDGAPTLVDMGPDDIGLSYTWRCGPASRDIGSPSFIEQAHAFQGLGLRPLSPTHMRATRSGGGDLAMSWLRRTRIGGDSWDTLEVPLAEDSERYEIDILDGPDVVRALSSSTPAVTYTAADQTADFGAPQSVVAVRIAQLSATFGRGTPASATL